MLNRIIKYIERLVEMMAMLFACRVVEERTPFAKVPARLKASVAAVLINDFGLPELVPTEYGGTDNAA